MDDLSKSNATQVGAPTGNTLRNARWAFVTPGVKTILFRIVDRQERTRTALFNLLMALEDSNAHDAQVLARHIAADVEIEVAMLKDMAERFRAGPVDHQAHRATAFSPSAPTKVQENHAAHGLH
jgi:hypothetical protein